MSGWRRAATRRILDTAAVTADHTDFGELANWNMLFVADMMVKSRFNEAAQGVGLGGNSDMQAVRDGVFFKDVAEKIRLNYCLYYGIAQRVATVTTYVRAVTESAHG